jgi:uncharacterized repeat protein (TIGR03803 family)
LINTTKPRNMKVRLTPFGAPWLAAGLVLGMLANPVVHAQTYTVLYYFTGGSDGAYPWGQPTVDKNGNIFGTAPLGGSSGYGTVWEYSSGGAFSVLHSFDRLDGSEPFAGVKLDEQGNMFGTTSIGGSGGGGTAYEITSGGTFSTLYNFGSQKNDPDLILSGVTLDASSNLYGASELGGLSDHGTVWKLSNNGSEEVFHSFTGGRAGEYPTYGNLKRDGRGNLYGVTAGGGASGYGTLFEISSGGTFGVLHNFNGGRDGCGPSGNLLEYKGSLYGTAQDCGSGKSGTVWQYNISRATFTLLHSFSGMDGATPMGGVNCQPGTTTVCEGNLFGTTISSGTFGAGTVWEIDASGTFRTLHYFGDRAGSNPYGCPFVDQKGNVYGTTSYGDSSSNLGYGTLWEITAAKKTKRR